MAVNIFQALDNIKNYIASGKKVVICLDDQFDSFKNYLDEYEIEYQIILPNQEPISNLSFVKFNLIEGFELYK